MPCPSKIYFFYKTIIYITVAKLDQTAALPPLHAVPERWYGQSCGYLLLEHSDASHSRTGKGRFVNVMKCQKVFI